MDKKFQAIAAVLALAACVFLIQSCEQPAPAPVPVPAPAPAPEPAPPDGPRPEAPAPLAPEDVPPTNSPRVEVGGNNFPTGYAPDREGTKGFLRSLDKPTIREAGPDLFKDRPIKDRAGVFLYRSLMRQYKKAYGVAWVCGRQEIGDCVSWGWHHGIAMNEAIEVELGRSAEFRLPATEAIYGGSRVEARGSPGDGARAYGGWGDGSYGAAAAKWVNEGGVLFRQKYDNFDLTTYSGSRAKEWGAYGCGGKGDGGKADAVAKEHPVQQVALVRNFTEAAAAISSGYPVPVCSGQGFASTRDKDGFAAARGSWAHCMVFCGVRNEPRKGLLCLNSWGPDWIGGPKWPDDQPDGSFWVEESVVNRMLSGEDSFAVSGLKGFPFQDLDNGDWVQVRPAPPKPLLSPKGEAEYALSP